MYYIRNIETAVSEMAVSEMIVSKDKKLCNMRFFDRTKEIAALQEIKAMSEHSAQFTVVTGRDDVLVKLHLYGKHMKMRLSFISL